jgi:hypothetical protein
MMLKLRVGAAAETIRFLILSFFGRNKLLLVSLCHGFHSLIVLLYILRRIS